MLHFSDDDASWYEPDSTSDSEPELPVPDFRGLQPFVSLYPDTTFKLTLGAKFHQRTWTDARRILEDVVSTMASLDKTDPEYVQLADRKDKLLADC
jgi:hypothetical protein